MFERIHLDPELANEYGLDATEPLSRLGSVVGVTGPNGSGKTRLLNLLARQLQADRAEFARYAAITHPEHPNHKQAMCDMGCNASADVPAEPGSKRAEYLAKMKRFLTRYRPHARVREFTQRARWPGLVYVQSAQYNHRHNRYDGDHRIKDKNLLAFPQETLNKLAQARHLANFPGWRELEAHEELLARADAFAETVRVLIDAELGVQFQGTTMLATLNGRRVDQDALSDGQRVLLRWAQIIHEEVADIRDAILLIDEPELHLHPDALIEAMRRLVDLGPAQLWIATHSIPILAWMGAKSIYYMNRGRPTWAGNDSARALAGLLGGLEGTTRLRTFLSDVGSLAFHQFAAECLMPPGVAPLREGDPQAQGFVTRIGQLLTDAGRDVRVLEYGAGRGRLVEALVATPPEQRARLHYFAYNDPDRTPQVEQADCRQHLAALGSPGPDHYCEDLREHQLDGADKMDAVVLCNVLHEIEPKTWPKLMATFRKCLRPDGQLLILEDQRLSVGELPHDAGFLVLDAVELCELFGVALHEIRYADDGRVSIAEIAAEHLTSCTPERVNKALSQVQTRALKRIKTLRSAGASPTAPEHRRGREHAYFAMLYTNATLARTDG